MNTIWKFPNTTGIIIFFNPIIGNTSFAMMNRINGFQIISAPIRQNGRMINSILSTKNPVNEQKRYIPPQVHHPLQSEHCSDESEYFKLLYMPETYILFRFFFKDKGYTEKWWNEFNGFSHDDLDIVKSIVESNDFSDLKNLGCSNEIKDFLQRHYLISREDINNPNSEIFKEKKEYDNSKKKQ